MSNVEIVFLRHGRPAAQTTSDTVGTYRIRLHVGLYAIQLPAHGRWQPTRVAVLGGRVTHLDITVATGIR